MCTALQPLCISGACAKFWGLGISDPSLSCQDMNSASGLSLPSEACQKASGKAGRRLLEEAPGRGAGTMTSFPYEVEDWG